MKNIKKFTTCLLIISIFISGCGYEAIENSSNDNSNSWTYDDSYKDNTDDIKDTDLNDEENNDTNDIRDETLEEEENDNTNIEEEFPGEIDEWKFENIDLDNRVGVNGYYINQEDYLRLISHLQNFSQTEVDLLLYTSRLDANANIYYNNNYNVDNKLTSMYEEWEGSCYGMSVTSSLKNLGILSANDLNAANTLANTEVNKNNLSAINFYFWQQYLAPNRYALNRFMNFSCQEQIENLITTSEYNNPFTILFYYYPDGIEDESNFYGHAIVGYGIEWENITWKIGDYSHSYDAKILIYDCNYPYQDEQKNYLYINSNDGSWCYPAYNAWSITSGITDSVNDNAKFGCILANTEYLNVIDYNTGELSNVYENDFLNQESVATVSCAGNQSFTIQSSSGKADVHGLIINDSTYGNKIQTSARVAGKSSNILAYIPQNESFYQISSEKQLNFALDVGNMLFSVQSDSPGEFTFYDDGSIEMRSDDITSNCTINITTDQDNAFGIDGCNSLHIEGGNSEKIKISQALSGMIIEGDDLSKLTISSDIYGKKTKLDISTANNSVCLSKDKNEIQVSADSDHDGKFETIICNTEIPKKVVNISLKNRTVTYNEKTQNIGKATVTGTTNSGLIYVYYSDSKCKKESKNHKNVGTYYVKAFKLNESGTFYESNIAKLIIKPAKQSVSLKKRTYTIKANTIKKKDQHITLKSSSKTKATYKKLSGNSNISVAKNGKITIKKGLKKGTYKIRIKITAPKSKNWKACNITVPITIKIK